MTEQVDFDTVSAAARADGLGLVGAFHPGPEDGAPEEAETLILLGPDGPDMWDVFSQSPEALDGGGEPMDRWSVRVISTLAALLDAEALFPFSGPPWQPFQRWAMLGEGAVASPMAMQASPTRGLWASYRGALAFRHRMALPGVVDKARVSDASPCAKCSQPCVEVCPVQAFGDGVYDVPACTKWLSENPDAPCHNGCLVRRSCPAGAGLRLPSAQRSFHITAFLRANGPG
ncbi:MAG: ferredoxin [Pseudomonadota bacterium]